MIRRLAVGGLVSAAVGLAGWRADALSGRGAVAATVVGTGLSAGSSWRGMTVLATFFVSSSALSRRGHGDVVAAKGSRRDERQVLANGGVATLAALVTATASPATTLTLVGGSLAAATSDTWATELGAGSSRAPRLMLSGHAVAPGTSGGVTQRGSLASLAGALAIGVVTGALVAIDNGWRRGVRSGIGVTVAGVAGSLTDSILGERVQERRRCPECDLATEAQVHTCGATTVVAGGVRGVDNDVVNLVCTAVGSVAAIPFVRRWD